MKKYLYCPDCSNTIIIKNFDDREILFCINCGKVFLKDGDKYRYIMQTSGNNCIREILNDLRKR